MEELIKELLERVKNLEKLVQYLVSLKINDGDIEKIKQNDIFK